MNISGLALDRLDNLYKGFSAFFDWLIFQRACRNYLLLNLLSVAMSAILTWFFASRVGDSQLIFHYNIKFGVDYIATASNLYFFPAFGLLVYLLNIIAAYLLDRNNRFYLHLFMLGSWFVNNLIIATIGSLYLINFR